jgi:hypothetical protein
VSELEYSVVSDWEARKIDFFLSFSTSLLFVLALLSRKTVVSLVVPMFAVALRTSGGGGGGDVSDSGG